MGMVNRVGSRSFATSSTASTSFVGRRRELKEARATVSRSRLTTLTGPGGVGKTRLGMEVGQRLQTHFRDGAWMVDLGSLNPGATISPIVASALAIQDQSNRGALERVTDYLQDKELLLFLDNCEHALSGPGSWWTESWPRPRA